MDIANLCSGLYFTEAAQLEDANITSICSDDALFAYLGKSHFVLREESNDKA